MAPLLARAWVVTGTDTGVGKTVVTAAVAAALRARGVAVRALKPVESGATAGTDTDASVLGRAAGHPPLCLRSFAEPLSPHLAAERAGLRLRGEAVLDWIRGHVGDFTLVEGAGGWAVPLCRDDSGVLTLAEVALATGAEVVVVARNRLGVLNHAALTVASVHARGLSVSRLVVTPGTAGIAESLNVHELARSFPGIPVVEAPVVSPQSTTQLRQLGERVLAAR